MQTDTSLKNHLSAKGFDPSKPLFLSLDCDRTIVNRKQTSHAISPSIIDLCQELARREKIVLSINTGRDWTAYEPLHKQLGPVVYVLLLSGRVCYNHGIFTPHPAGALSNKALQALFSFIETWSIPFIDAQFAFGNIIWSDESIPSSHYKPFKPLDWNSSLALKLFPLNQWIHDLTTHLLTSPLIRVELPIYAKTQPELFRVLQTKNLELLRSFLSNVFPIDELELLPILSRSSLCNELATLRIMTSNKTINKGIGLRDLVEHLKIPQANVVMVGDSDDATASDLAVKHYLPESTLCVVGNPSILEADFHLPSIEQEGICPFLKGLLHD